MSLISLVLLILINLFFPSVALSAQSGLHFENITDDVGLNYGSVLQQKGEQLGVSIIDNDGVYAADINNDHWTDLLTLGGEEPGLFINKKGVFKRREAFPTLNQKINSALFVDYNRDGWRDLVLIPHSGSIILLVNRKGKFFIDEKLETPTITGGVGGTAGDFNNDGCPDLFVIQYGPGTSTDALKQKRFRRGARYRNLSQDNGYPNYLFKGDCSTFEWKNKAVFKRNHWSLATSFLDFTGNNKMDIHIANDYYRDSLYLNLGNNKFSHRYLDTKTDRNGMSSEITDFNQDGQPDLFISNTYVPDTTSVFDWERYLAVVSVDPDGHNALLNVSGMDSQQIFKDKAKEFGLLKGGWGWSVSWNDFNNDFDMELIQSLQNHLSLPFIMQHLNLNDSSTKNFAQKYHGDTFISTKSKKSSIFGKFEPWLGYPNIWFRTKGKPHFQRSTGFKHGFNRVNGRGMASIDYDRDGDLDAVFSQYQGKITLYENHFIESNMNSKYYIKVDVVNPALGGQIKMENKEKTRYIHISARTDFASQEPSTYHIGLNDSSKLDRLLITRGSENYAKKNIPSGTILKFSDNGIEKVSKND